MMDLEMIRRKMAWRREARIEDPPEGSMPAIEDGREVEDRLVVRTEEAPEEGARGEEMRIERWVGSGGESNPAMREAEKSEGEMRFEERQKGESMALVTPERYSVFTPERSEDPTPEKRKGLSQRRQKKR